MSSAINKTEAATVFAAGVALITTGLTFVYAGATLVPLAGGLSGGLAALVVAIGVGCATYPTVLCGACVAAGVDE